jgi:hypothetical protein
MCPFERYTAVCRVTLYGLPGSFRPRFDALQIDISPRKTLSQLHHNLHCEREGAVRSLCNTRLLLTRCSRTNEIMKLSRPPTSIPPVPLGSSHPTHLPNQRHQFRVLFQSRSLNPEIFPGLSFHASFAVVMTQRKPASRCF